MRAIFTRRAVWFIAVKIRLVPRVFATLLQACTINSPIVSPSTLHTNSASPTHSGIESTSARGIATSVHGKGYLFAGVLVPVGLHTQMIARCSGCLRMNE